MQLFSVLPYAPPPPADDELAVSVQLFNAAETAPPPKPSTELPLSVQLYSVPPYAAPPAFSAQLPVSTQLDTTALVDSPNTPPPPSAAPLVRVKPTKAAPLAR